ncbi:hypothetical protein KR084_011661, partial [Drosophila pseudotakahashii]
ESGIKGGSTSCALGGAIPEGLQSQLDDRIVGVTIASISYFPWQLSLQRYGYHFCGAIIYSPIYALTAAHCLPDYVSIELLSVRAGSSYWFSGGEFMSVASKTIYEDNEYSTWENDIALIKLKSQLTFSSNIQPIALASSVPENGADATVSGWGTLFPGSSINSPILMAANLKVSDTNTCASDKYGYGSQIKDKMFCAAATFKGACQGASGGPLVSGGVLIGIFTWRHGCIAERFPGVYTSIPAYRVWVTEHAGPV